MSAYGALTLMVLLTTTGQVLLKRGARRIDFSAGASRGFRSMCNRATLLGGLAAAAAPLLYIYALTKLPLSMAYGFSGLGYVGVVLAGRFFLKERITLYHVFGSLAILCGLAIWNSPSIFP
jgi:drug/metabolite transporter (DMT)-like permease